MESSLSIQLTELKAIKQKIDLSLQDQILSLKQLLQRFKIPLSLCWNKISSLPVADTTFSDISSLLSLKANDLCWLNIIMACGDKQIVQLK